MYEVKESDGMYGIFKGDELIEEFYFECEAWERIAELKRVDKYRKWGVPLKQDITPGPISEEQEEKLATEFKVTMIELWNRFHAVIMFVACVAAISSWAWFI
jgi:hypothetical protein